MKPAEAHYVGYDLRAVFCSSTLLNPYHDGTRDTLFTKQLTINNTAITLSTCYSSSKMCKNTSANAFSHFPGRQPLDGTVPQIRPEIAHCKSCPCGCASLTPMFGHSIQKLFDKYNRGWCRLKWQKFGLLLENYLSLRQ